MNSSPERRLGARHGLLATPVGRSGQAFVELSLVIIVLVLIGIGAISMAQMLSTTQRMASVAREVGRQIAAYDYDTNDMVDVLKMATNIIYPANFGSEGKIVISFVQRVAATDSSDDNSSLPAHYSNDVIRVNYKFYYPYASSNLQALGSTAPNNTLWHSDIPEPITNSSGKYYVFTNNVGPVKLDMLQSASPICVVVEVFYTNRFSSVIRNLGVNPAPYVYEVSVF